MPEKKNNRLEKRFIRNIARFRESGLKGGLYKRISISDNECQNITDKIDTILVLLKGLQAKNTNTMLCFIMYDIEDNKIRTHIGKYLLRKGCIRVQRSVFIGNVTAAVYKEMSNTLAEVNDLYDNHDSIFFLPIGEDNLNSMRVIGVNVDFEIIKDDPNTFFF